MARKTPGEEFGWLLYQALGEPIGLLLLAPDRERARQLLYKARQELGDPALAVLQFRVSPFAEGDLVICKAGVIDLARPSLGSQLKLLDELNFGPEEENE